MTAQLLNLKAATEAAKKNQTAAQVAVAAASQAAEARRLIEADLARRDAEAKAAKAAQARSRALKEMSEDIFRWVRETGPAWLAVVVGWAGKGLAAGAVRLEKAVNGTGLTLVKVSAVRGQTDIKVGKTWLAALPSLPQELRKELLRAGWVTAQKKA